MEPRRRVRSAKLDGGSGYAQPVSLGQADHRQPRIGARELGEALVARLAVVTGKRRVDVVRIDLERDEAERVEATRIDDRHVVRGLDRRAGEIRAGAPAEIPGLAPAYACAHWLEQPARAALTQQLEGVSAADDDEIRSLEFLGRMQGDPIASLTFEV
jgi:hypothetical protein